MAPKVESNGTTATVDHTDELGLVPDSTENNLSSASSSKTVIVWRNVVIFSVLHMAALYSLTLVFQAKILTLFFTFFYYQFSGMGITAGAHRLWSHRSYKAKTPFRILLAIMNSAACENDIIEWARDHRVHHKYSETDSDPHNASRGFFFAHMGWLLVRKHDDVKVNGKKIDISDLYADPVLRFQRKYYAQSVVLLCFIVPTVIPYYFWGESLWNAFYLCAILRYCVVLHSTWLVNSAAHMWGMRPYDKTINPRENLGVVALAAGEGFHNYHHVFPQDYSTSEWGRWFNTTTCLIDFMAIIGQVYDRKKIPQDFVDRRRQKTGEKSHGN